MSGTDGRYTASTGPFNGEDRLLLARLDERTRAIHEQLEKFVTKETFRSYSRILVTVWVRRRLEVVA